MLQSDHIFPLKPLDKDLLENSQSVCGWVWCVCVCIYEKTWASFHPSSQMGRSMCVFVFPISLIIFTDSLLWLSLWIPGMCTFTLFCSSVEHVCVFIWFDFYLTQELRSLSTKARELLQDLCAPALLNAWLSRQSDLAYGQRMRWVSLVWTAVWVFHILEASRELVYVYLLPQITSRWRWSYAVERKAYSWHTGV